MTRLLQLWNISGYGWTLIIILMVFIAHNAWWLKDGIRLGGDTSRYTESAQSILDGEGIKGKALGYIGYSTVLAIVKSVTPNKFDYLVVVVGIQIIVAIIALLCLFKIGQLLYSVPAGLVVAAVSSVNYIVIQWNHWVLAESLFASLLPISVYLCIKTARKPYYSVITLPVILLTALVRPNGMLLLLVFLVYLYSLLWGRVNSVITVVTGILLVIVFLIALDNLNISARNEAGVSMSGTVMMDSERDGKKIYRKLKKPVMESAQSGKNLSNITKGHNLREENPNVFMESLYSVYEYPFYTIKLIASRLYASYFLIRVDYSKRHNLFLYLVMPVFYVFVLIGIVVSFRKGMRREHLLILGVIAAQSAIVAFSMADHDHRYFSYIVNLITLYFGCGLVYLVFRSGMFEPPPDPNPPPLLPK